MRPRPPTLDPAQLIDRPGLLAARTIGAGQVRLAEAFGTWADRADQPEFAERFRSRIPLYVELHRSTLRLVEIQGASSSLVVAQQSEMIQQPRTRRSTPLSAASLYDLDAAPGELAANGGRSLRREAIQRRNILILDTTRLEAAEGRPITNARDGFVRASRALADEARPLSAGTASRLQRRSLAGALERPRQDGRGHSRSIDARRSP